MPTEYSGYSNETSKGFTGTAPAPAPPSWPFLSQLKPLVEYGPAELRAVLNLNDNNDNDSIAFSSGGWNLISFEIKQGSAGAWVDQPDLPLSKQGGSTSPFVEVEKIFGGLQVGATYFVRARAGRTVA
jgi:hypothetical protein